MNAHANPITHNRGSEIHDGSVSECRICQKGVGGSAIDKLTCLFAAFVFGLLVAVGLNGCASSQHPRTHEEQAHIGVNAATHVLRDVDDEMAARYTQAASDPASDLDALDRRYGPLAASESLALSLLRGAEYAIDHHDLCAARVLILRAADSAANAVALANSLGSQFADPSPIRALAPLAASLAPICTDAGVSQ